MVEELFDKIQQNGHWESDFDTEEVGCEKPGVASFYTYGEDFYLICAFDDGTRTIERINEEDIEWN